MILKSLVTISCVVFVSACSHTPKVSPLISDTLIITHPTSYFAGDESKEEINQIASQFLDSGRPTITLVHTKNEKGPVIDKQYREYFKRIDETEVIYSDHGENIIRLYSPKVTIIGGYWAACLKIALRELVRSNIKKYPEIKVRLLVRALYGKSLFTSKKTTLKDSILQHLKNRKSPENVRVRVSLDGEQILEHGKGGYPFINVNIVDEGAWSAWHRSPSSLSSTGTK